MAETTTTISRPSPYVEAFGKSLTDQVLKQIGKPIDTSKFAPQIVDVDPFTQQAIQRRATAAGLGQVTFDPKTGAATGVGAGTGIAAYQPFMDKAQEMTGPDAYKQFLSPYQQEVIDKTLEGFDRQQSIQRGQIGQAAIESGAFGGGREGVALGEFDKESLFQRAALEAGLRQSNFQQAQALASQGFDQQTSLAQMVPGLESATAAEIGRLGSEGFAYRQAIQDAEADAARTAAFEPFQRLGFAQDVLSAQYGGGYGTRFQEQPQQSPLQQALGAGIASAGIIGAIRG